MLLSVWSCIVLEIDFPRNYSFACLFFFSFFFVHVWCWVNLGSTLSSQAPLSFIPPSPHALYTPVVDIYTIWTVALLACVYTTTTTTLWWLSILPIEATSRHTLCCCRGYGAHGMDLPESMWITTIVIATSVISCLLSVLPSCSWGNRDFLLIDVFLVTSPPSHICSPAQARHHTWACGSCRNMLITLQFLLLHIVHEWKREKKRWRKGSASLKKCVQSSVCVCVCKLFPPTLSLLSDLGLLVHSRDIFLKEKKSEKQAGRDGRTA